MKVPVSRGASYRVRLRLSSRSPVAASPGRDDRKWLRNLRRPVLGIGKALRLLEALLPFSWRLQYVTCANKYLHIAIYLSVSLALSLSIYIYYTQVYMRTRFMHIAICGVPYIYTHIYILYTYIYLYVCIDTSFRGSGFFWWATWGSGEKARHSTKYEELLLSTATLMAPPKNQTIDTCSVPVGFKGFRYPKPWSRPWKGLIMLRRGHRLPKPWNTYVAWCLLSEMSWV